MTAPGGNSLQFPGGTGGGWGGPVQLVEVSSKTAASVLSQPTSPNVPLLSSPQPQQLQAPKDADGEDAEEEELPPWLPEAADWEAAEAEERKVGAKPWHAHSDDEGGKAGGPVLELAEGEWDPRQFVGDWSDNLGHRIMVSPAEQRGGGGGRRRGKGRNASAAPPRLAFLAVMQKLGVPEKRFTINKALTIAKDGQRDQDKWGENWTCGNGSLSQDDSHSEVIVWQTEDGRKSSWQRIPPEGAVFFDPPPQSNWEEFAHEVGWEQQPVYYMVPAAGENSEGAGENSEAISKEPGAAQWQQWTGGEGEWTAEAWAQAAAAQIGGESGEGVNVQNNENKGEIGGWNPNAREFVPSRGSAEAAAETGGAPSAAVVSVLPTGTPKLVPMGTPKLVPVDARRPWGRTPTPSPMLGPMPSPSLRPIQMPRPAQGSRSPAQGPMASPAMPPAPPTITVSLSEESPDCKVDGAWLEWSLPDPWSKLSKFPKDFCITSPMFGVRSAANMQLAFYPNGSRTAEAGLCTVSLTRGPDSAGIKFEFLVNGRGIGPKVCLGRRYLGDYPKPFGDSEESNDQKVVVRMQVLKVL